MTISCLIQRANEHNIDSIAQLLQAYQRFYKRSHDRHKIVSFVKTRLQQREVVIFLAYDTSDFEHHRAVGIAQLYPLFSSLSLGKIWILQDLYIDEVYRNTGYGKALLDHIKQFAINDGAFRIVLKTDHNNLNARAVYERYGFSLDNEYVNYRLPIKPTSAIR